MLTDEDGHTVEFCAAKATALVEADGFEPELGQVLVPLHGLRPRQESQAITRASCSMDVRRLGPVIGVEEEPIGASPEHGRHPERWHRDWPAGNARSACAAGLRP